MTDVVTTLKTLSERLQHLTIKHDCKAIHDLKQWLHIADLQEQVNAYLDDISKVNDDSDIVITIHYRDMVYPRYGDIRYEVKGSNTIADLRRAIAERYTIESANIQFKMNSSDEILADETKLACCTGTRAIIAKHLNPDIIHIIITSTGRHIHITTPPHINIRQLKTYILAQEHIAIDRQQYMDVLGAKFSDDNPVKPGMYLHVIPATPKPPPRM